MQPNPHQQSARSYQNQFPEYFHPPADVLDFLQSNGWEDYSWGDDVCPSWQKVVGPDSTDYWRLWTDAADPADRELPGHARYVLVRVDGQGEWLETAWDTEDAGQALALLAGL